MFRKPTVINVNAPTEYVTREVREYRAPTDESVRLLKEMEEVAAAKVLEAVHVGDTTFECVIQKHADALSDCVWLCAIFSLNGMKRTAEVSFHPRDFNDGEIDAILKLRDEIAKVVAGEMIAAAVSKYKG